VHRHDGQALLHNQLETIGEEAEAARSSKEDDDD
jgi:hypothetical protein